jgi:hypothetical protein
LTAVVIGTSLSSAGPIPYRGFIDVIDAAQGVRGWVLNLAEPENPQPVQLLVGDVPVAEITPDGPRADISQALGVRVTPGFAFDASWLAAAVEVADSDDDTVTVRIAETDYRLGSGERSLTVADIMEQQARPAAPAPRRTTAGDLQSLLDELREDAAALAEHGLRPTQDGMQGFIETVAIDPAGQVWVVGWMRRGHGTEFAAVISDQRKYAGAMALLTFARPDLDKDACGIMGLLSSDWRPGGNTSEFHVFFGDGGCFHLRSHLPVRFVTTTDLVAEYESVRSRCAVHGHAAALQRLLASLENWLPSRPGSQAYATETSIDRVLLIPGLGCLAEGWVLSPMKRVEALRLRIGGAVMSAQPEFTYWKPRPDLLSAFPGSEAVVARAGFVALFTGDGEPEDFADPMLKIVFDGGASTNFAIPHKAFRLLGHSALIEDALRFFPALQEEAFFPRFAEAAIRAQRGAMTAPVALAVSRTRRAFVLVLPEDRCDLFLLFEELMQQCRAGHVIDGIAFVASSKANRSDALWLFREFQAETTVPASLLVIDEAAHAFALLPDILHAVNAKRFVFVGAGVFLTEEGWRHARSALQTGGADLTFLGLEPDEFEQRSGHEHITARCFAWAAAPFLRWAATAAPFLGGYHRENGLYRSTVPHVLRHNAARTSRTAIPSRIQEAVNAAVYSMAGPF